MAVKPTEVGGSFNPAAAQAKRQSLMEARRNEVIAAASIQASKPSNSSPYSSSSSATVPKTAPAAPQSNYSTQSVGTAFSNSAITLTKIQTLKRKNPEMGNFAAQTFGIKDNSGTSSNQGFSGQPAQSSMDRYTKNALQTLFSAENHLQVSVQQAAGGAAEGISSLGAGIQGGIAGAKQDLNKLLAPVSSFTGSTLGALTNLARNPLGAPQAIGNSLMHVMDKVSPGLTNKLDSAVKLINVDGLQHSGTQLMGGISSLMSLVDSLLSVPFQMAEDLYNGVMQIMQQISQMLDGILSSILDLFFGPNGLLDMILPMDLIMGFLEAVGELASVVGDIGNLVGGFSMVTDFASQVQGMVGQASSALSNPLSLAQSYLPSQAQAFLGGGGIQGMMGGQVGQYMNMLRNPEQALQQMLPPSISQQFQQLSQIPGLGRVGNTGFGLGNVLDTVKQGVISSTMSQFSQQAGILGPLLRAGETNPLVTNTQQAFPPSVVPSSMNPSIPTVQNVPIQTTPAPKIFQNLF